ncbi:MAG: P-loop ATPase, Sll1717 family [Thalassospira sp.]|uniref:P-loop ATPase, Sll1717 family n=1 Tax=Thalassospira sp. TaxID=1912094 RepID=UPI003A88A1A2
MVEIVIRKNVKIGAATAEEDQAMLQDCFIDNGDLDLLLDVEQPESIIVGRTGTGKSALLSMVENSGKDCMRVNLEELSLNYIENSSVIRSLENSGVNLDLFYQLLWRHVIAVEIIRCKFNIISDSTNRTFFTKIFEKLRGDRNKERTIEYLERFGDKFWLETEERIKEITNNFEKEIHASVEAYGLGLDAGAAVGEVVTKELIHKVKDKVMSSVQMKELNNLISIIDEDVLDDGRSFYVLIDNLDEVRIRPALKYKLIRSLIETVKKFRKIQSLKIIVALRNDLLKKVIDETVDSGFQEEKYEDLYLRIYWRKEILKDLVNKRINNVFKMKYTSKTIDFYDVFSGKVGEEDAFEYMISRTMLRPREIIIFSNLCFHQSDGKSLVTARDIRDTEKTYSKKRVISLKEEWNSVVPELNSYFDFIRNMPSEFDVSRFNRRVADDFVQDILMNEEEDKELHKLAVKLFESQVSRHIFLANIFSTLYLVGAVGLRLSKGTSVVWSYDDEPTVDPAEIRRNTPIYTHPMLWRALNITPVEKRNI